MTNNFPDDDNGEVLRRMQSHGDDLTLPRDIDFSVLFKSREGAEQFCNYFSKRGFVSKIKSPSYSPAYPWDTPVVNHMVPTHAAITAFEDELERIAAPLGGKNDGWGSISQPPPLKH